MEIAIRSADQIFDLKMLIRSADRIQLIWCFSLSSLNYVTYILSCLTCSLASRVSLSIFSSTLRPSYPKWSRALGVSCFACLVPYVLSCSCASRASYFRHPLVRSFSHITYDITHITYH